MPPMNRQIEAKVAELEAHAAQTVLQPGVASALLYHEATLHQAHGLRAQRDLTPGQLARIAHAADASRAGFMQVVGTEQEKALDHHTEALKDVHQKLDSANQRAHAYDNVSSLLREAKHNLELVQQNAQHQERELLRLRAELEEQQQLAEQFRTRAEVAEKDVRQLLDNLAANDSREPKQQGVPS